MLHVFTMLENPLGWSSRYRNFALFAKQFESVQDNCKLYVMEILSPGQSPMVRHLIPEGLVLGEYEAHTCEQMILHKGQAINRLMQELPYYADCVAWVDADVVFTNPDWVQQTLNALEQYPFVQMFSHVMTLDKEHAPLELLEGFVYCERKLKYLSESNLARCFGYPTKYSTVFKHPGCSGFAWASHVDVLFKLGGLVEFDILGSGDMVMASSLYGKLGVFLSKELPEPYITKCFEWQEKVTHLMTALWKDVGLVPGMLTHYYHGDVKRRRHASKHEVLAKHNFNPETDLTVNKEGLYILKETQHQLLVDIETLLRERNEDLG